MAANELWRTSTVSEPLTLEMLQKAFDAIANAPRRVHGTESDPHLVHPRGTLCVVCGRRVSLSP